MGLAGAGVAISAGAQIVGGSMRARAQRKAAANSIREGALRAELADLEADDIQASAASTAERILNNARVFRATQVATQAASGVVIGEGSAQQVVDLTNQLAHADAMVALYEGANKASNVRAGGDFQQQALNNRAEEQVQASKASLLGGFLGAAGTVAGGFGSGALSFGGGGGGTTALTTSVPTIATDARGPR